MKDSDLVFKKGVNLITGGSDSGKTYAYELINFAFGGSKVPNEIKESKGYNVVFLEISINNFTYTIVRFFNDPKMIKVCQSEIDSINEKTVYENYNASSKAKESISDFFMKKLGYEEKIFLKKLKRRNELKQLTIRSYLKSFMISEEKITAKTKSIIETELTHPSETFTREKFAYLLTMRGNQKKVKIDKNSSMRANNKLELLQELLVENKNKLIAVQRELENNELKNDKFLNIDKVSEEIKLLENQTSEKKDGILKKQEEIYNINEDKNKIQQTINRFTTLSKQYEVEMDRLDFIYEGESYLNQITKAICPLCNSELEVEVQDQEKIYKSFNAEKTKIAQKRQDIGYAIKDMEHQYKDLSDKELIIMDELNALQLNLDEQLIPNLKSLRINYDAYIKYNEVETKEKVYKEEISNIESRINIYQNIAENKIENEDIKTDNTLYLNRRKELCEKMEELLGEFHFAESVEVEFDDKEIDFIVNNQKRKAYGQGYSSLVYIAFVLSLKWIMDKYGIPTPEFIIFDSPFTSLTEGDVMKQKKVLESNQMVDAFFDFATKEYKNKQLILFENSKEKYEQVNKDVHYIHFTKNKKFGRYGFIVND